jgi:fructose-1,6-bisphosphatase II
VRRIARAKGRQPADLTLAILDRPRHQELIGRVLATGARIKYLLDGDVAGAIMAASDENSVDVLVGIGGTPEGVIAACALRCLDGELFGRLHARDANERSAALAQGYDSDLDRVLTTRDLVWGVVSSSRRRA